MNRRLIKIGIIVISLIFTSCIRFTFSGASIPEQASSFSVQYFQNNASLVMPTLSQKLTDKLRERMESQTPLTSIPKNGDLSFEGEITSYTFQPTAISSAETATLNKLTVTVNVRFVNKLDESKNFETKFSRFQQFDSQLNVSQVEESLVETICDELVDDIFNKALVNW